MKTFAIVGCGNISNKHADAILKAGGVINCLCDIDRTKTANLKNTINFDDILVTDSITDIPKQFSDYIVIATPHDNTLHYSMSKFAIEVLKIKNIVVEKPAMQMECFESLTRYKRTKIYPVVQNRFLPEFKEISNKIAANGEKIKEIYVNVLWSRPDSYYSGWRGKGFDNVVSNQALHYIDLALCLIGGYINCRVITELFRIKNTNVKTFDTYNAIFSVDGVYLHINATTSIPERNRETTLKIVTDKDFYIIDFDRFPKNQYNGYVGSASLHPVFYDILINSPEKMYDPRSVLDTLEFIDNVHKRSRSEWEV